METVDNRTFKEKFDAFKWNVKQKAIDIRDWCADHKEITVAAITIGLPALYKTTKTVVHHADVKHDDYIRDHRTYDPSTGDYLYLKKPLRNDQKVELAERMAAGESKTIALSEMGVLKRH